MGVRREDLALTVRGEVLAQLRVRARISQAQLAGLSGVSNATISRIERGHQTPSLDTVEALVHAIAGAAGWKFDELIEVAFGRRTTWSHVTPIMNRMERLTKSGEVEPLGRRSSKKK